MAGDLGFADPSTVQFPDFRSIYGRGCGPTELFAVLTRMCQASLGPLLQNLAFERRENGQQASHRSTGRRRQVQRLSHGDESHSEMVQFLEGC